jgi:hypothetical protein
VPVVRGLGGVARLRATYPASRLAASFKSARLTLLCLSNKARVSWPGIAIFPSRSELEYRFAGAEEHPGAVREVPLAELFLDSQRVA